MFVLSSEDSAVSSPKLDTQASLRVTRSLSRQSGLVSVRNSQENGVKLDMSSERVFRRSRVLSAEHASEEGMIPSQKLDVPTINEAAERVFRRSRVLSAAHASEEGSVTSIKQEENTAPTPKTALDFFDAKKWLSMIFVFFLVMLWVGAITVASVAASGNKDAISTCHFILPIAFAPFGAVLRFHLSHMKM